MHARTSQPDSGDDRDAPARGAGAIAADQAIDWDGSSTYPTGAPPRLELSITEQPEPDCHGSWVAQARLNGLPLHVRLVPVDVDRNGIQRGAHGWYDEVEALCGMANAEGAFQTLEFGGIAYIPLIEPHS